MQLPAAPSLQKDLFTTLGAISNDWRAQDCEVACAVYLGARDCSVKYFTQNRHSAVSMNLRALVEEVFARQSKAVIISHFHPTGSPTPSAADHRATRKIAALFAAIDVTLVDHIIFAHSGFYSFRNAGNI